MRVVITGAAGFLGSHLVDHYIAHPEAVPDTYRHPASDPVTAAIDYVSGMTDRFASWQLGGRKRRRFE